MYRKSHVVRALVTLALFAGIDSSALAVDSASFEFGVGNQTKMARAALHWKWDKQWLRRNDSHIGGYWDVSFARWHGDHYRSIPGNTQNLTSIGITPVFRWQNNSLKGLYAEAGVGANLLSEIYDNNDRQMSTRFQFGDHIGVGYVFQNNLDLGLKLQHFSNGGIKSPNDGVNFAIIRLSYSF